MLIRVGDIFIEKNLDPTADPPPDREPWRVRALKQLWLDRPDFDFLAVIQHPAFADHTDALAAWHRQFQKHMAYYQKRATVVSKRQAKLAPPGDVRLLLDPWEHARRSALYADLICQFRSDTIEGGHWCWKARGSLDDD